MNPGKRFEADFKASVPKGVYYLRLHDSANSFSGAGEGTRFALKSPYDCILCKDGEMYCIELKSHKGKSLAFAGSSPAIQQRQIDELMKARAAGAVAGLVINFRDYEETWFVDAADMKDFVNTTTKKSVNLDDVKSMGMKIPSRKLKINYRYDITNILGYKI